MHTHTNAGAAPEQTTKSFKKKAFERIIWQIPLHPDKNIPHSKKTEDFFFFPKNLHRRGLQPPINVLDFLKTLIWESSSLLHLKKFHCCLHSQFLLPHYFDFA